MSAYEFFQRTICIVSLIIEINIRLNPVKINGSQLNGIVMSEKQAKPELTFSYHSMFMLFITISNLTFLRAVSSADDAYWGSFAFHLMQT